MAYKNVNCKLIHAPLIYYIDISHFSKVTNIRIFQHHLPGCTNIGTVLGTGTEIYHFSKKLGYDTCGVHRLIN